MSNYLYSNKKIINCSDTNEVVTGDRYLSSRHWRLLRERVYLHYGRTCQRCLTVIPLSQATIHHRTYKRLGNEKITDLVLYCNSCHATTHKDKAAGHDINITLQHLIKSLTISERESVVQYIATLRGDDPKELLLKFRAQEAEKRERDKLRRRDHKK